MHLPHCKTKFRNGMRNITKTSMCCHLQSAQFSVRLSIYGMCWTNRSNPWEAHQILAGFQGSAANVLVPETTGHSQVVLMLWLISRGATDQKNHGSDRFSDQSHRSDHFSDQQKKKKKTRQINISFVFLFINTFTLLN